MVEPAVKDVFVAGEEILTVGELVVEQDANGPGAGQQDKLG